MGQFLNALSAVFMLFCLMSVGFILGRLGWMKAPEKKFVSRFVVNVAVPFNSIYGILNNLSHDEIASAFGMVLCAFLGTLLMLFISLAAARCLKLPKARNGVFTTMAFLPNTLFIGLPMCTQLFGEKAVPYIMLYWIANTVFTNSVAVMLIEHSGTAAPKVHSAADIVKDILTKPPIVATLFAFICLGLNIRLPQFVMSFSKYMSSTTTPLAMLYSGYVIYELGLKNVRLEKGIPLMLFLRLIVGPAVCSALCVPFGVEGLARSVFIVEAALPVVTQTVVMAGNYGADEKYCATGYCLSTLGIFITIPLLMLVL